MIKSAAIVALFLLAAVFHTSAFAVTAADDDFGIPGSRVLIAEVPGVLNNDRYNGETPGAESTAVLTALPSKGFITCPGVASDAICSDGSFSYTPNLDPDLLADGELLFDGNDSFQYRVDSPDGSASATANLSACEAVGATRFACWNRQEFVSKITALGLNAFVESFEGSVWDPLEATSAASANSKSITWSSNFPALASNELLISTAQAHSGTRALLDQGHGHATGTVTACDVDNPDPATCLPYDGVTGTADSGLTLSAVGGYVSAIGANGNISIFLDGVETNIAKLPSPAHYFFGVIETAGFSSFKFQEMDGKVGNTQEIFIDDVILATSSAVTNTAPVLTAVGAKTVAEGVRLRFDLGATDDDGDVFAYTATGLPTGAGFTDNQDGSATFNWRPGYTDSGSYQVTFEVSDNQIPALTDSETITITVTDTNRAPVLAAIGNQSVLENTQLGFSVSATDADGDNLSFAISGDPAGVPAGVSFTDNGYGSAAFSWTPTSAQVGSHSITISVTDDGTPTVQSDAETFVIQVTAPDSTPPVVTPPSNILAPATDGSGTVASHPLIASFLAGATATDDVDGAISSISNDAPAKFPLGVTTVTFSATDSSSNTGTATASVNVTDQTAPIIELLGTNPVNLDEGSAFTDPGVTVSDNVDSGLTATVSGSVDTTTPASYTLTYSASDSAGNTAAVTRTVIVKDITPPTLTAPADITVAATDATGTAASSSRIAAFLAGARATDAVDGAIETIRNDAPTQFPLGSTTVTFSASDAAGNVGSATARVSVTDQHKPLITLVGANSMTINVGQAFSDPGASAQDNVDGDLSSAIVASGAVDTGKPGIYPISYDVSDAAGNAADTVTRNVSVQDAVAPVITPPANLIVAAVDANGTPASDSAITAFLQGASVSDDVDTALEYSHNAPTQFPLGQTRVTFSATDSAGNTGSASAMVQVDDQDPPRITLVGGAVTLEVGEAYTEPGYSASDNVDGNLSNSVKVSGVLEVNNPGVYTLSYDVVDAAGNAAATVSRSVSVQDGGAPVVTPPAPIVVTAIDHNGTPASDATISAFLDGASALDSVDGAVPISAHNAPDVFPLGITTVIFSAVDSSANTGSAASTVNVVDKTPPVIALLGQAAVTLNVGDSYTEPGASVSDNVDGDLQAKLVISGQVDTTTAGTYTLSYDAADAAGNNADTVTRQVTVQAVIDTTAPVITLNGFASISIDQDTTYVDSGATAQDDVDGDISAAIVVDNPVDTSLPGSYQVSYNVSDSAGNAATTVVRQVTVNNIVAGANTAPVVTAPPDLVVDSTGRYTAVDLGLAQVTDDRDTGLVAQPGSAGPFKPGRYEISWRASDSEGLEGRDTQVLWVRPLVGLFPDQYGEPGEDKTVRVKINDKVPFAVNVDLRIIAADGSESSASLTIKANEKKAGYTHRVANQFNSGQILFEIIDHPGDPAYAAVGKPNLHKIFILNQNVEPDVQIKVLQNGHLTHLVTQDGGAVSIKADVDDPNVSDRNSLSCDWSKTDNSLLALAAGLSGAASNCSNSRDDPTPDFSIDPSALNPGYYKISVKVSDGGNGDSSALDVEDERYLKVISTAPALGNSDDSDQDGSDDQSEGHDDDDEDYIPDYQDAHDQDDDENELIPGKQGHHDKWLLSAQPGTRIRLGPLALQSERNTVHLTLAEIERYAQSLGGAGAADTKDSFDNVGGYFDFEIDDLAKPGQSVFIAIPLHDPIPDNAVYRKYYLGSGWKNFVSDSNNKVYSAAGDGAGGCPAPGAAAYSEGLTAGHWCLQLLIEDGGVNDSDGERNGSISDPGGIATPATQPGASTSSGGGGGGLPFELLILLLLLLGYQHWYVVAKFRAVMRLARTDHSRNSR